MYRKITNFVKAMKNIPKKDNPKPKDIRKESNPAFNLPFEEIMKRIIRVPQPKRASGK